MAKWRYTTEGLKKMGTILREAREMKGLDLRQVEGATISYEQSQYKKGESLPNDLGVSYSTINRYENGLIKRVVDPRVLGLLIEVLSPLNPNTQKPYQIQDLIYIAMDIDPDEEAATLSELIYNLERLVELEAQLKGDEKAEILGKLEFFRCFENASPNDTEKRGLKTFTRVLKGLITELPDTSELRIRGNRIVLKISEKLGL